MTHLSLFHRQALTLMNFPLESWCEDQPFLDHTVEDLSMVLILSSWTPINTSKLDAAFDKADAIPFQSLQNFCLWLVLLLIILDSSLLLASNLVRYGVRPGLYCYLYHRQVKGQPLS